jgi:Holliday junction resolvase RusA-like endonuclease
MNQIWRSRRGGGGGRPRVYRDPRYTRWLRDAGNQWLTQRPKGFVTIEGPFEVIIQLGKLRINADADNRIKPTLDALQQMGVVANDKFCRKISIERGFEHEGIVVVIDV